MVDSACSGPPSDSSAGAITVQAGGDCSGPNTRTEPPAGAIVVDATGAYEGSFKTVSEGVANLDLNSTASHTIFVFPGVYHE
ncbi:unnamed protein product [Phytophthora lilii]|uniref:Unnamed protein product n=1 Tax=Phytophthora lilii TaxID=2077276 RepID=A0A9W6WR96_9STRA|nr:unnamed protein product [Phytophthora lilii]